MKWIKNGLVLAGALVLCFLVLEVALQVVMKDQEFWQYDPLLGTQHIPGKEGFWCKQEFCHQFQMNTDGFRDDSFAPKKSGEKRILLLGDSFMEALQVAPEEALHAVLEQQLQEKYPGATVYNLAVSNYGPTEYLLSLLKYGKIYQPDLVVLALFPQNDLISVHSGLEPNPCRPFFIEGTLRYPPASCALSQIQRAFSWSKTYRLLVRIKKMAVLQWKSRAEKIPLDDRIYLPQDREIEESYAITGDLLRLTRKASERLGAPLVVMVLTTPVQMDVEKWKELQQKYPDVESTLPQQRLGTLCIQENISCLFLYPSFQEYQQGTGELLHYAHDGHWNAAGHRKGAELLWDFLQKEQLLS